MASRDSHGSAPASGASSEQPPPSPLLTRLSTDNFVAANPSFNDLAQLGVDESSTLSSPSPSPACAAPDDSALESVLDVQRAVTVRLEAVGLLFADKEEERVFVQQQFLRQRYAIAITLIFPLIPLATNLPFLAELLPNMTSSVLNMGSVEMIDIGLREAIAVAAVAYYLPQLCAGAILFAAEKWRCRSYWWVDASCVVLLAAGLVSLHVLPYRFATLAPPSEPECISPLMQAAMAGEASSGHRDEASPPHHHGNFLKPELISDEDGLAQRVRLEEVSVLSGSAAVGLSIAALLHVSLLVASGVVRSAYAWWLVLLYIGSALCCKPTSFVAPAHRDMLRCLDVFCPLVAWLISAMHERTLRSAIRAASARAGAEAELRESRIESANAMERNALLEAQSQEKDAVISHEMKTPLNGLLGMLSIAKLRAAEAATQIEDRTDPHQSCRYRTINRKLHHRRSNGTITCESSVHQLLEEAQDYLTKADACGALLLSLIDDILDSTRLATGTFSVVDSSVCVASCVEQVVSMVSDLATGKGLEIKAEIDQLLHECAVWVDGRRLTQVLLNLASNAIKFTERGSIIVRALVVGSASGSLSLRFVVEDTGIGIAEDFLTECFERYAQGGNRHNSHSVTGSLGIGLYLCRQLVEHMNGQIWLDSKPNVGTRAHIQINLPIDHDLGEGVPRVGSAGVPRSNSSGSANGAAPRRDPPLPPRHILVVDDYPYNVEVATALLEADGHVVSTATNGSEALAAIESARKEGRPFDACLMDVNMPVMDGLRATRELRERELHAVQEGDLQAKPLRVIGLTAYTSQSDQRRCEESGMDHYLAKPLAMAELRKLVAPSKALFRSSSHITHCWSAPDELNYVAGMPRVPTPPISTPDAPVLFDFSMIVSNMGGNVHIAELTLRKWDSRPCMEALTKAIRPAVTNSNWVACELLGQNGAEIGRQAHRLKSMCKYVCAQSAIDASFRLERAGKAFDPSAFQLQAPEAVSTEPAVLCKEVLEAWAELQHVIAVLDVQIAEAVAKLMAAAPSPSPTTPPKEKQEELKPPPRRAALS